MSTMRSQMIARSAGCGGRLCHVVALAAAGAAAVGMMMVAGCSGGGGGNAGGDGRNPEQGEQPAIPTNGAQRVFVFASQIFGPLMGPLESAFERDHPEFDLVVTYGVARAPLDADQDLQQMISDGVQPDVFLAGDLTQVEEISREPMAVVPWLGNRLVLVRQAGSRLRLIDLSRGNCEIAVALERTPLGRASRAILEERGIWSELSERVGLFVDGQAIVTRTASPNLDPLLGIVYASTSRGGGQPIEVAGVIGDPEQVAEHVISVWSEDGRLFAQWLMTPAAEAIAVRVGFLSLTPVEVDASAARSQGR